jgi:predicted HTH transcriptional regulator
MPVWEEIGTAIRVSFKPHAATEEKINSPSCRDVENFKPRHKKILNFLHDKEPLSAKQIHEGLLEKISARSLRSDLLDLKDRGYLKMSGSGPGTLWRLIK